ncbi:alpha/beta fold hydrolase [Bradyrhizobium sp. AUGA SZCCT0182]|uniref:alpha/beta fold hydrolase n=1 Tax=Bradyrhizobium sp. AUGA SZCCT0182 TaxID=2807667 RepID=UPI00390C79F6
MSRIPVVFVPGLAADGRLWQPVMDGLASVVDPKVAACKGNSIAAWADEILSHAPDRFFIAGTSMGGYVALEVALRGDDRLAGVILLNTNARSASPQQRERGGALIDEVRSGSFDQVVERLAGFIGGGKPELTEAVAQMTRDAGADTFVRQQQAVLERQDRRAELPRMNLPTLVIAGDDDRVTPPSVNNEIARLVPEAELEILACGHLSTLEVPSEVSETIERWLAIHQAAAPAKGRASPSRS